MNKDELIKYINDLIKNSKSITSVVNALRYSKQLDLLKNFTLFLSKDAKIGERIYCLINNINSIPLCPICNNKLKFNRSSKGYYKHCSTRCSTINPITQNKSKKTTLVKYGDKNYRNIDKSEKTKLERYGDKNYNNKEKKKETCIKIYGKDYTNRKKFKETMFRKYGHNNCSFFKCWKKYTLPSGVSVNIQGYEHFALDDVLKYFEEDDVIIGRRIIRHTGLITYTHNNKKRFYYPDIFIKKSNKIIEVKSTYTFDRYKDINLMKMNACIKRGFDFEFRIYDRNGNELQRIYNRN